MKALSVLLIGFLFVTLAHAKYSGGSGTADDPYQIATAEDLMLLGETPEDYDKHFVLTADIDLDPNLPGRKVFDRAVIAPDTNDAMDHWGRYLFDGKSFKGIFRGNGHKISHLSMTGAGYLGLFGRTDGATISDLGLEIADVNGTGDWIGGLVGNFVDLSIKDAILVNCYSSGMINGREAVGGLVGDNFGGSITSSYSRGMVSGNTIVGGLIGINSGDYLWSIHSNVTKCYSTCTVVGITAVGGLLGCNSDGRYQASVGRCYSTGAVSGIEDVGGLVGINSGSIARSYSTGLTIGVEYVGGLVGENPSGYGVDHTSSFWDVETSGMPTSAVGTGKTTAEMQTATTFLEAGWDFVDETANGTEDIWCILEGQSYPRLWWQCSQAFAPNPPDGATDVSQLLILSWATKGFALYHDVYFGGDRVTVATATPESPDIYRGRQVPEMTMYDPGPLELDQTYYWRIDEVDGSDPNSMYKGNVWSFTTPNFLVVDDFEDYNDYPPHEIYSTWIDGYEVPHNGAQVDLRLPPYWYIGPHSGSQAMVFLYSNTAGATYSEAERTFTVPQNWTRHGIQTLGLWFYGVVGNTGQLYVKINGVKVPYDGGAGKLAIPDWQPWNMDLTALGVDLQSIRTLAIGIDGNTVTGRLHFDDIRLYRPTPQEPGS